MTVSTQDIPEELHVLAGEYVLGALDAGEMRAVRRQAMVDPTLAAAIVGWEQRLAPLARAVPAMPPPDALWARIEETIAPMPDEFVEDEPAPAAAPRVRLATLLPSDAPAEPVVVPMRPAPRRRVWPWQLATVASLALAASVGGVVLMPSLALRLHVPMLTERFAPRVALLMPAEPRGEAHGGDGTAPQFASAVGTPPEVRQDAGATSPPAAGRMSGFLVEARPDGTLLLTPLAPTDLPAGKALELWALPPGATAPKSLGVMAAAGQRMTLPAMPAAGTTLLVSVEPQGGSPTGAPTGPVVYSGKLGQLQL